MSSIGAALPWASAPTAADEPVANAAAAAANAAPEEEEDDDERALPLEAVGLAIGGRIEVRWDVHVEGGESYSKVSVDAWGARTGTRVGLRSH